MAPKKLKNKATKASIRKPTRPAKNVAKKAAKKIAKTAKGVTKPTAAKSLLGKPAPNFSLPLDDGGTLSLTSLRGKRVVLYFYPKDDTPGCTVEACAFRDRLPGFSGANAAVIGVSKDSVASHSKFRTKFKLNFPLASDDGKVCEAYGVWKQKSMYGRTYMGIERSTFIIDEHGSVRAEWRKVSVAGHADEVSKALAVL